MSNTFGLFGIVTVRQIVLELELELDGDEVFRR